MEYDFLRPEDQARILKQRVARIEREHFQASLDAEEGPSDASALPEIEERLAVQRKRLAEVEKKVKSGRSS